MKPPESNSYQQAISERLFKSRIILISGEINQKLAGNVTAQLMALSSQSTDPITLFINSQGGHVESGDTIHDMIRFIDARIRMVGTGWVGSAGALIYISVPVKDRYCLPNTRFLWHQPAGGVRGSSSDISIKAEQIVQMRRRINKIFARQTGQPIEKVKKDTKRNFWLNARDAKEYGIVGQIVENISEVE